MKQTREEKMKDIQDKLLEGTQAIFESDKYKEYLSMMSRFPSYSLNNCILIAMQCPDATYVCGYKKWQEFERTVDKGEKGIMILAPMKKKVESEEEVYDENHKLIRDKDGNVVTETVCREYMTFRPAYVFDYGQTSGKELPSIVTKLNVNVEDFEMIKDELISLAGIPVSFEEIDGSANGYFSPKTQRIVVKQNMPQLQTIKTLIHEIAHFKLGHGTDEDKYDRQTKEVQAESVAYWVSQMIGLDTSDYSFGYISGWSKDRDVPELKEHLNLIKVTADAISKELEERITMRMEEKPLVQREDIECKKGKSRH